MNKLSITAPQTVSRPAYDGAYHRPSSNNWSYEEIRNARKQPTAVLVRNIIMSPMLAASWSVDTTPKDEWRDDRIDEEIIKQIEDYLAIYILPLKTHMQQAVAGCVDYGFQCFEKIIELDEQRMVFYIKELKSLLPEYTTLLVDDTGELRGVRNEAHSKRIDLDIYKALVYYMDVEGTNWYGESTTANSLYTFEQWLATAEDMRYLHGKVAGTRFILYYPPGTSTDENGQEVDNRILAGKAAKEIMANRAILFPNEEISEITFQQNDAAPPGSWRLETIEDSGNGYANLLPALEYWDNLMCRAYGAPERSVLEAQFGSKADAEEHTATLATILQIKLDLIMQIFNQHLVNQMIRVNYGTQYEDIVSIKSSPITDEAIDYIRSFYQAYALSTDEGLINELPDIDWGAMASRLRIPKRDTSDVYIPAIPTQATPTNTSNVATNISSNIGG